MGSEFGILFLFFYFFFNFNFYFILLYNAVLVLPYIDMNPARVYMSVKLRREGRRKVFKQREPHDER